MIPLLLLLAVAGLMQAARTFSDAGVSGGTELAFGFLLLAAYFTGKIFSRFGLPKLTGYLAAGALAGPFLLQLVTPDMTGSLTVVSDTATAIIALQAGSELQLKSLRPVLKVLRGITLFAVIGSSFTIGGVLYLLHPAFLNGMTLQQALAVCLTLGLALSAKSPAVVMALLAETRAEGPLSSVLLASVVVADLAVITLFSVMLSVCGAVIGGSIDVQSTALAVAWQLLGSLVFGLGIGMLIGLFLRTVKNGAPLFALLVCVVVAEIGARISLDPLIVMLAAGIWLRNFSRSSADELLHKFEAAQLPVFLVFFALAGAKLHLDKLYTLIIPVAVLAATRAASFFFGARMSTSGAGLAPAVRKYTWVGLLPQAGLAIAIANVLGKTFGEGKTGVAAFGTEASTIVLGVVAMNELIAPAILRGVLQRSGEVGKKQGIDFAAGGH